MNTNPFSIFLLLFLLFALPAVALEEGKPYGVRTVIDGDTLVLEGGETVRLMGINAPEVDVPEHQHQGQPYGQEAKAFLKQWLEGKKITLKTNPEQPKDRYNRTLASLYTTEGQWVQARMVREGYAHVYSFKDNRLGVKELLEVEKEAIAAKRGIWGTEYHRLVTAEQVSADDRRFHLVEGVVQQVAIVKGNVYLNFGEDWKSDFTAFIPKAEKESVEAALGELKQIKNKKIQVRGWVFSRNGAMIEVTHPEQVTILQ
jgi:endonuclease YncB( thermonuclease family)